MKPLTSPTAMEPMTAKSINVTLRVERRIGLVSGGVEWVIAAIRWKPKCASLNCWVSVSWLVRNADSHRAVKSVYPMEYAYEGYDTLTLEGVE